MMKKLWFVALAIPLMAAGPNRPQLTLTMPSDGLSPLLPPTVATPVAPQRYQPAPLPNRTMSAPTGPAATTDPHVAPTLFTTREQYRGDGFSRGSTAQSEQEHRVKPTVGFSLHMPFTPE